MSTRVSNGVRPGNFHYDTVVGDHLDIGPSDLSGVAISVGDRVYRSDVVVEDQDVAAVARAVVACSEREDVVVVELGIALPTITAAGAGRVLRRSEHGREDVKRVPAVDREHDVACAIALLLEQREHEAATATVALTKTTTGSPS